MKTTIVVKPIYLMLLGSLSFFTLNSQVVTIFSENFDGSIHPYTAGTPFTNSNCSNFLVASNYDPAVCNFFGYPISTDASGSGKFLFEGTINNGTAYNDDFYTTTANVTLLAGVTYTIQFDVALANDINPPVLTASLGGTALGAAFSPTNINNWQTISYTITPVADMVNPVFNLNDAQPTGNGNDFGIDNIRFSFVRSGTLPVRITSFSTLTAKQHVLLQWTTAVEQNNQYFSIERSTDRISYNQIGTVKGSGTTSLKSSYSFADTKPVAGINYYRLKQVDNDGKFTYSYVVTVTFTVSTLSISTFPNPVIENLTINLSDTGYQPYIISLVNMMGGIVMKREVLAANGVLNVRLSSNLSPGVYMVMIKGNNTDTVTKIMVR